MSVSLAVVALGVMGSSGDKHFVAVSTGSYTCLLALAK